MGSVRLYAIAITEFRDFFGASPQLAAQLRKVAAQTIGEPSRTPTTGLVGKLGPLLRRPPDAPVVQPDVPTGVELNQLLAGHFVPPHRLPAAWRLVETWLDAQSWGRLASELSAAQLSGLDFDLARHGVPARFALGDLVKDNLAIPLRCPPGTAAGYLTFEQADGLAAAWRPVVAELSPEHRDLSTGFLAWLDRFPGWALEASTHERPEPDLVVILHG